MKNHSVPSNGVSTAGLGRLMIAPPSTAESIATRTPRISAASLRLSSLVMILSRKSWPKIVDNDGLTLGDGTRIPWSACTHVQKQSGRTDLIFGGTTVPFSTFSIRNGRLILAEIRKRLGVPES